MTLAGEGGLQEHLLLTSKPVCKRIVRLEAAPKRCSLTIDQADCLLERVALTGLSSGFAMSRIRQRLVHRGCVEAAMSTDAAVLYAEYQAHVHGAIFSEPYFPEDHDGDVECDHPEPASVLRHSTQLLLHPADDDEGESGDGSVSAAVDFARRLGWSIAWQPSASLTFDSSHQYPDRHVFHMPVPSGVRCRADLFHQLLNSMDENSVLVYADHDHVDVNNVRSNPILKPEWNPELLLNMNYIGFPWMVSESWTRRLGLAAEGTRHEAQDLVLLSAALGVSKSSCSGEGLSSKDDTWSSEPVIVDRTATRALTDQQVRRVPRILASLEQSPIDQGGDAGEISARWERSLRLALSRAGSEARVDRKGIVGVSHVSWPLPDRLPSVDIIIPTRDKADVLKVCIDSVLQKTRYSNYRIVLVDNDSVEPQTADYYRSLAEVPRVELLRFSGAFNYSAINNHAIADGDSRIVVLLNNDTEVISPDWLDEMVRQAIRPDIGCVGAKLHYSNGRIQHGGVIVGITGVAGHAHRYSLMHARGYGDRLIASQNMTAVTAACLAIRREIYQQVGGLDQDKLGVAWNDVDLCMKVRSLGYRNLWTPHATLYHHEGLSRGADDTRNKMKRVESERQVMMTRWALNTFQDPAYHPLLARDNESFSLGKSIH